MRKSPPKKEKPPYAHETAMEQIRVAFSREVFTPHERQEMLAKLAMSQSADYTPVMTFSCGRRIRRRPNLSEIEGSSRKDS